MTGTTAAHTIYEQYDTRIVRLWQGADEAGFEEYLARFTMKEVKLHKVFIPSYDPRGEEQEVCTPHTLPAVVMECFVDAYLRYKEEMQQKARRRTMIANRREEEKTGIRSQLAKAEQKIKLVSYNLSRINDYATEVSLTVAMEGWAYDERGVSPFIKIEDIPYERLYDLVEDIVAHPVLYLTHFSANRTLYLKDNPLPSSIEDIEHYGKQLQSDHPF